MYKPLKTTLFLLVSFLSFSSATLFASTSTNTDPYALQRLTFLSAEKALKSNNRQTFWILLHTLKNYPLYPYLRYEDIRARIDRASEKEITTFIQAYADTPVANRLYFHWLDSLARKKDWQGLIRNFRPNRNIELNCWYHQALLATGQLKTSIDQMNRVWLNGKSLPENCNPVIQAWAKSGALSGERVWKRIGLAVRARNYSLARYLRKYLPKNEHHLINTWIRANKNPFFAKKIKWHKHKKSLRKKIILSSVKRIMWADPAKGSKFWKQVRRQVPFTLQEKNRVLRVKALSYASIFHKDALYWLNRIPKKYQNRSIREWKIRVSLYQHNWKNVLREINKLPLREKHSGRWQYWKARALLATGKKGQARSILKKIAKKRSYEGFLSADILKLTYSFQHQPLKPRTELRKEILQQPNIIRARELFKLDRLLEARREWYRAIRAYDENRRVEAALIAKSWGWQGQAINTLAKTRQRHDLEVRFPVAYLPDIKTQTTRSSVDPAWALAMIRQESTFVPDARSRSNARGLMQLMPATARYIANKTQFRLDNTRRLFDADVNIRLGVAYLDYIHNYYNGHPVLATAAYNAGKGRVDRWLPKKRAVAADIWVETIPYRETRNYTRNVIAFTTVYEKRLGIPLTPLHKRMPPVKPANNKTSRSSFSYKKRAS